MQVSIASKPETSEVELTITASAEELSPYVRKAAAHLSQEHAIKGFRPGKAPIEVVEQVLGTERVLHEALDRAVPRFFVRAVLEHEIEALGKPAVSMTRASRQEGAAFTARVAVLPQVTLGELSAITVEQRPVSVSDEEVERELTRLAKMRSQFLDVARPAQLGDTVRVDFRLTTAGKLLEGGEGTKVPVHLGEGYFLPDFEQKLVGIAAGDQREFTVRFPDDFRDKQLAGNTVHAHVKAHAVLRRVLPAIDDAFAKGLGKFADLKELRQKLRENLHQERAAREEERRHGELADKLAATATFAPIPAVLIDREVDRRVAELREMLALQQKSLEEYLRERQKQLAQLRDELRPAAERRVKVGLALRAFAEQEQISADETEVAEKVQAYLNRFATPTEARAHVDVEDLREHLTYLLRNQKAMARLEQKVTLTSANPAPTRQP